MYTPEDTIGCEAKREFEVDRELETLSRAVSELNTACSSLEKNFESVVRSEPTPENVSRPEQSVNTKLGAKIAQIRRTVEEASNTVYFFIQRKEV